MGRWSIWKKLAVFPSIVVVALLSVCAWVIIDETLSAPRFIDGHADDAPRNASAILGSLVFVLYCAYLAVLGVLRAAILYTVAERLEEQQMPNICGRANGSACHAGCSAALRHPARHAPLSLTLGALDTLFNIKQFSADRRALG